eukprot:scaffold82568_cov36-Phaeocystis_antarctica.AAC.1
MVMGSGGGSRLCVRSIRAGGSSIVERSSRGGVCARSTRRARASREFGEGNNHTQAGEEEPRRGREHEETRGVPRLNYLHAVALFQTCDTKPKLLFRNRNAVAASRSDLERSRRERPAAGAAATTFISTALSVAAAAPSTLAAAALS